MSLKPLALAVTAASQRELFHVPAAPAGLRPAFLAPAQPGQVSFLCAFFFRGAIRAVGFKNPPPVSSHYRRNTVEDFQVNPGSSKILEES